MTNTNHDDADTARWITTAVAPAADLYAGNTPVHAWMVQELRDDAGRVYDSRVVPGIYQKGRGLVPHLTASRITHVNDPF
ncbi:hypothetical protein [Rhodococcus phenolicus]|uniref:hypothetical protein n=1 Tax=Rhodococcus phenolicus TaxID=263849 RepID=UPI00082A81F2|nr:hypothetical protein [Rhodococcus phenolicus]